MTILKSTMIEADAFLEENPPLALMMEQFYIKHDIPEFEDQRLAKPNKDLGRSRIRRARDIVNDDVQYQEAKAKGEEQNILYRVMAATNEQKIIADENITTHLEHMGLDDKSNTVMM